MQGMIQAKHDRVKANYPNIDEDFAKCETKLHACVGINSTDSDCPRFLTAARLMQYNCMAIATGDPNWFQDN